MTQRNETMSSSKEFARIPVRRDEQALNSQSSSEMSPLVLAILHFQKWIFELQKNKLAHIEPGAGHVLHIKNDVMQRFFLGVAEEHIFLGVPTDEMDWFNGLPWLHVALRKGSDRMNLVSEEASIQNVTIPYFALAFHIDSEEKINILARNKFLHIREVRLDSMDNVLSVSSKIAFTIDIVVVEDDRNINGLLASKHMKSSSNRSVIRA